VESCTAVKFLWLELSSFTAGKDDSSDAPALLLNVGGPGLVFPLVEPAAITTTAVITKSIAI